MTGSCLFMSPAKEDQPSRQYQQDFSQFGRGFGGGKFTHPASPAAVRCIRLLLDILPMDEARGFTSYFGKMGLFSRLYFMNLSIYVKIICSYLSDYL